MKKENLKIEYKKTADLIPYVNNARTHSVEQVSQVAASIKEFGFTNPILVDGEGGVIAGHGRLMAANKLKMDSVPCVELKGLSEAQKKAYVIADNQLALNGEWNLDLLKVEIEGLKDLDFDVDLLGLGDDFLGELLPSDPVEGLTGEDEVPGAPDEPVSVFGDLWVLGNHRLVCGDCTNLETVQVLTDGQFVDMWLTDPPYNVEYKGKTADALTIVNDNMKNEDFRQFLVDAYTAADSVMKPGAVFYIWHADSEGYNFRGACVDVGWDVRQCLIWEKSCLVMGRQDYQWKHEPCLYGWKSGAGHLWATDRKQTTILEFDKPSRNGEHPTMKPVELFEYQMLNNTKGGDQILDSFAGSGTTIIACEKHGRFARAIELDPKYVDVIINRWQNFTGKDAVHAVSGKTYNELKGMKSAS